MEIEGEEGKKKEKKGKVMTAKKKNKEKIKARLIEKRKRIKK